MSETLPNQLKLFAHTQLCLADWRQVFGTDFDTVRPLMAKVDGRLTTTYPAPWTGIRYDVDMRKGRYMGYVPGYVVTGIDDRWFEIEDIQIWRLDPDKVAAFLGPMNAPHLANKPVVKVFNDFHSITLPNGRCVVFGRKYKRRAFLRAVTHWCQINQTDTFPAEKIIEDYNNSLPANQQKSAITTSRIAEDLFKGQTPDILELIEPVDRSGGIYRLRVVFEASV